MCLRRSLAALILLGMAVAGFAALGRWQLHRADERRTIRASIEAGRREPPLVLSAAIPEQALRPWRAASVQGVWRNDLTVLVDNRNLGGRPGLWVATPLQREDGTAVLVLRGWLPRPMGDAVLVVPPGDPGVQQVTGELAKRVPRLFELPGQRAGLPDTWPGQGGDVSGLPRVQNLDLAALTQTTGLDFMPVVLLQTHAVSAQEDGLLRDWPQPSVDADQNVGYAMQWFAFATIAAIAWLVVLWRALRWYRRRGDNTRSP